MHAVDRTTEWAELASVVGVPEATNISGICMDRHGQTCRQESWHTITASTTFLVFTVTN